MIYSNHILRDTIFLQKNYKIHVILFQLSFYIRLIPHQTIYKIVKKGFHESERSTKMNHMDIERVFNHVCCLTVNYL